MAYYDKALRSLLERVALNSLKAVCKQPDVQAAHRITAYYSDGRAAHSVATLIQYRGAVSHPLTVVYDGLFDHQPITHNISADQYDDYITALRQAHFDKLADQADSALSNRTIWCVERASGTLHHRVILMPDQPEKPYSLIVNAIDAYIPEAIREIPY